MKYLIFITILGIFILYKGIDQITTVEKPKTWEPILIERPTDSGNVWLHKR